MGPYRELELPNITVKTIRPLIDNVLSNLTAEDWRQLKLGAPNNGTRFQLAELVMNMTWTVSSKLLATLGNEGMPVTVEKVKSSLGNALCFALGSSTNSATFDQFTELVSEEVTERINASLHSHSTSTQSSGPPQSHQTTPNKVETMVSCLCSVLKESVLDIKSLFKPRVHSQKTLDLLNKLSQGKTTSTSSDSDSTSYSRYSDSKSSSESTVRSSDSEDSEAVQDIFMKEFRDIMELFVDEIAESDLIGLISESSLEFKSAADEIYQKIRKEESVQSSDSCRGSKFSKSPKGFWKGVGQKIRKLFLKLFATASMLKMGTEVRKKFCKGTKVQSSESVKSLMDSVGSLLLTETKNRVSPENAPVLSNVLYRYIIYGTLEANPADLTKVSVPKSLRKMYADIKERVTNSLPLMNWWFSKVAGDYTKRVLTGIESILVPRVSEIDTVKEREESRKKIYLSLLIDQLVTRVYSKSKVIILPGEPKDVSQNLFEKTWAEVQDIDFDTSPKSFDKLHKVLFKDLCKMWGCPEMLLLSFRQKEPEVEKRIGNCVKSLLSNKPIRISRFCSWFSRFFNW
ncbi:unnamed protein product [Pleuronectes platessa]|uniref:Uncharacterized protein n=1 Tax=Pleuronectes platessa TaxID=8262 RepID=A0A9N7UA97_PLEPL|nr:unnamed protein product [Pleuronectes platessa]